MVFLPIADRELRVAARKRSTLWMRIAAAAGAVLIGAGFFILTLLGPWFGTMASGRNLFAILTWLCLAAALSAGLFFTCDSLSEEKREGTLGFLFLTDLRGKDVIIGKLAAGGLRGLYGMLAVLPVLAVTLFMGGVTGIGLLKTSLALLNALLASLVAGLFVSALSKDSHKSLAATVLLLGLWVAIGPVIDAIVAGMTGRGFQPLLSLSSPGYVFVLAHAWGKTPFWWALLVNQMLVWMFVGFSSVLVRRTWQDKPIARHSGRVRRRRAPSRRKLLDVNPVLWLGCIDRSPAFALWVMAILVGGGIVAMFRGGAGMLWMVWTYVGGLLSLIVYLFVASQAARFFVESRRVGLLELFLATPLTSQQIVAGQWRALLRMFGLPLVLFLAAQLIGSYMTQQQTWKMMAGAGAPTTPPGTTNMVTTNVTVTVTVTYPPGVVRTGTPAGGMAPPVIRPPHALGIMALSIGATVNGLANLAALVWFGMWMGLTSKNTSSSTLKTMFWVQILPWFALSFLAGVLVSVFVMTTVKRNPTITGQTMAWFPFLSGGLAILLSLGKDIFFCIWSRRKLYSEFRTRAAVTISPGISAATIRAPGSR